MAINYVLLGRKIQRLRSERRISQMEFAEMIATSSTFVSRLERGLKGPSLETLILIADALDVSLDVLLAENRIEPRSGHSSEYAALIEKCTPYEQFILLQSGRDLRRILKEAEFLRKRDTESVP